VAGAAVDIGRLRDSRPAKWVTEAELADLAERITAGARWDEVPGRPRLLRLLDDSELPPRGDMLTRCVDDAVARLAVQRRGQAVVDYCAARGRWAAREQYDDPAKFRDEFNWSGVLPAHGRPSGGGQPDRQAMF
jgi:hypothetical protein